MVSGRGLNDLSQVIQIEVKTQIQRLVQDPVASGSIGCQLAASGRPEGRMSGMYTSSLQGQAG